MRLTSYLTPRQFLIIAHDLIATAVAIVLTFVMRFEGSVLVGKVGALEVFLPPFLIYAAAVYFAVGLHRNKWRFTSVPDMSHIVSAATILAVSLLAALHVTAGYLVSPDDGNLVFLWPVTGYVALTMTRRRGWARSSPCCARWARARRAGPGWIRPRPWRSCSRRRISRRRW